MSDTSSDTSSNKTSHAKKKNSTSSNTTSHAKKKKPTPSKSLQDTTPKKRLDLDVKKTSTDQSKTSSNKTQKPSTTNDTTQNTSSLHASSSQVSKKAKKRKIKKAASASSSNSPTTTKKQKVSTTTISTTQPLYTFQYHASKYMNMCPLINIINLFQFMQCQNTVQRLLPFITQQNCQHYNKKEYPLTKPENFLKCCLRLVQDKCKYKCDLKHEKSSWKFHQVSQKHPICLLNNGILDWVCIYKNHLFDSARNTTTKEATRNTIWPYINGGTGTSKSFLFDYYIIREKKSSSSSSSSSDDVSSSKDSTSIKLSDKNDETSSQKKSPPNRKQIPSSSSTRKIKQRKKTI